MTQTKTRQSLIRILAIVLTLVLAAAAAMIRSNPVPVKAAGVPYALGDVFAGVGTGLIRHFSNTGTLKDTLNTASGSSEDTGMCFDYQPVPTENGSLRSTNFSANDMTKFDNMGNVVTHPWAGPFNQHPESCVLNGLGQIYVGQADGTRHVLKYDASGALLAEYAPTPQNRGTDWIDLAADQSTLYYTSEGNLVKRFNVTTNTQMADFTPAPLPNAPCYALRIMTGGDVLVACSSAIFHLSPAGTVLQTYLASTYGETSFFFALNLDPDLLSFWTAGFYTGNIYRINIATGAQITKFTSPPLTTLAGLAVFGEPVAGGPPPTTCPEQDGDGDMKDDNSDKHSTDGKDVKVKLDTDDNQQCEEKDQEEQGEVGDDDQQHVDTHDNRDGSDFHSSKIDSLQLSQGGKKMTVLGAGTHSGVPVTFVMVAVDNGPSLPGFFSLQLSDGYNVAGSLVNGTISLN